jgi:hypothetical protein
MREGIIKSLMRLFKKHQERDKENTRPGKRMKNVEGRCLLFFFSFLRLISFKIEKS